VVSRVGVRRQQGGRTQRRHPGGIGSPANALAIK